MYSFDHFRLFEYNKHSHDKQLFIFAYAQNVKMVKVALVMNARNEELYISNAIQSILDQELKPYRIIVINDGSTDETSRIVTSNFPDVELINLPVRNESHLAQKEIPQSINKGLIRLHNDAQCEYIWLAGGDTIFPSHYAKEIIQRMRHDSVVIASGTIENEYSTVPRGGGRIVDVSFWKLLGIVYPENYGWESYLLSKAGCMERKVSIYNDIIFYHPRRTGTNLDPHKYRYYGLALKALGCTLPYAIARSIFIMKKKNPRCSLAMLGGYFSNYDNLYEKELRDYVRRTQLKHMFRFKSIKQFFKIIQSR